MQQSSFTVTASHPLIWSTRDGTTVRCCTVAESAVLMGFPRGWQLPQGSRAGLRAVGNAVAAACRNGRRRGATQGLVGGEGEGARVLPWKADPPPQVPPPLAHAVMAAAVRVHAPAPAAPVPAAPPAGDDDPDDLHALRRKLRRLTERVV